jgi:hypothetical protein
MDRKRPTEPPSHLSPPFETDALLDRQLGLLTEALAERLARARRCDGRDPTEAFRSRSEIETALLVAHASADLVRAKARLRGEMQLRYHVLRLEGPEAARFARSDGACKSHIQATADPALVQFPGAVEDAVLADLAPPPPLPSLAEIAEALDEAQDVSLDEAEDCRAAPDDPGDGPECGLPTITAEESQSEEGRKRYLARWNVALDAILARAKQERAATTGAATDDDDEDDD